MPSAVRLQRERTRREYLLLYWKRRRRNARLVRRIRHIMGTLSVAAKINTTNTLSIYGNRRPWQTLLNDGPKRIIITLSKEFSAERKPRKSDIMNTLFIYGFSWIRQTELVFEKRQTTTTLFSNEFSPVSPILLVDRKRHIKNARFNEPFESERQKGNATLVDGKSQKFETSLVHNRKRGTTGKPLPRKKRQPLDTIFHDGKRQTCGRMLVDPTRHIRDTLLVKVLNAKKKKRRFLLPQDLSRDGCNLTVHAVTPVGTDGRYSTTPALKKHSAADLHKGAQIFFPATFCIVEDICIRTALGACMTDIRGVHPRKGTRERKRNVVTPGLPRRLLLFLMTLLLAKSVWGKAITCSAGNFTLGDTATVMCYFPDDIDNHDNVYIQYHPFNASSGAPAKTVLLCQTEKMKSSRCQGQNGFLKGKTRNTITVDIVNITKEAAGQYFCQFLPPDNSPWDRCNLTVHVYLLYARTGRVTPALVDDHNSTTDPQRVDTGGTGGISMGVLVLSQLIVAAPFSAVVLIVFCCKRMKKRNARRSRGQDCEDPRNDVCENENVNSSATDCEKVIAEFLLPRPYDTMNRVEESVEKPNSWNTSHVLTSGNPQTDQDTLKHLFKQHHDPETKMTHEAEDRRDQVEPLLQTQLDGVEHGQGDASNRGSKHHLPPAAL